MKFWLSLLLVLAVVSVLEARRGGRKKDWRRQRLARIQAAQNGYPAVANEDDVKDDDEDNVEKTSWMTKKQRKWAMKRQRKMKRMQKRRGMMTADDSDEEKPEEAQIGDQDQHIKGHRRRWQQHKGNRQQHKGNEAQRRQKWGKMKKMKKWMHKRPSCFCLQTEQLEKLQELIKKEDLEKEFPQIMPPEEEILDDETDDISDDEDSDDSDDSEESDSVSEESTENSSESEEVADDDTEELPIVTTESPIIENSSESEEVTDDYNEELPLMTTESFVIS